MVLSPGHPVLNRETAKLFVEPMLAEKKDLLTPVLTACGVHWFVKVSPIKKII